MDVVTQLTVRCAQLDNTLKASALPISDLRPKRLNRELAGVTRAGSNFSVNLLQSHRWRPFNACSIDHERPQSSAVNRA